MMLWDPLKLELIEHHFTQHWIFTSFTSKEIGLNYSFFNVYIPVLKECWVSLKTFKDIVALPHCILGGDMNLFLTPRDKKKRPIPL